MHLAGRHSKICRITFPVKYTSGPQDYVRAFLCCVDLQRYRFCDRPISPLRSLTKCIKESLFQN